MKLRSSNKGFTLIELIVALGLGLSMVAGVVLVFVQNNRSATQDEELARVLENGRFVMRLLTRELAMSNFWGKFLDIETTTNHASAAVGTECGDGANPWVLDLEGLQFLSNVTSATVAATFACLPSTDVVLGTDVVAVKRVADSETADGSITANRLYMRTNSVAAQMFLGGAIGTPPSLTGTESNWAYNPQVFYIRDYSVDTDDGIPTFCRAYLTVDATPNMENECLVEGVENFQIEFGVDQDADFVADYFTAAPTAEELFDSVSARIYLMVRSVNPVPGYSNDKTYTLGSSIIVANDSFFRRVFSSTVVLRNPANLTGLDS